MSTVLEAIEVAEATPEGLLRITDRPMPELIDDQLVERPTMGQEADAIAGTLFLLIGMFIREHGLGILTGGQGGFQIFPDQPRKVRIPDIAFTRKDRVPETGLAKGHARVRPDLVVEVVSPNDIAGELEEKIDDFFSAGVPLIWVVYPDSRSVRVYRPDGSSQRLRVDDSLDGEEVLPGFRVEVARLFDVMG